jgi:hypothetical protein
MQPQPHSINSTRFITHAISKLPDDGAEAAKHVGAFLLQGGPRKYIYRVDHEKNIYTEWTTKKYIYKMGHEKVARVRSIA